MRRVREHHYSRTSRIGAALLAISVVTSGCSSSSSLLGSSGNADTPGSASSSGSFAERFKGMFSGTSGQAPASAAAEGQQQPSYCPVVDVRQGASTLSVTASGGDPSAMQLRYQGTLAQTARECAVSGGNLTIKVGVHGRMILGPEGTPGEVEIPLRYALVREGPEPKTIWTRLYRFPVSIGEGQASVPFTHVEEDMIVPKPSDAELEAYVVYIGFDTMALKPQAGKKKTTAPKKR